jgi:hypothetical protein
MNRKLTIEKVAQIPVLLERDKTYQEIAETLGVSVRTINYWVARLKGAQVKLKITRGPKPLKLK